MIITKKHLQTTTLKVVEDFSEEMHIEISGIFIQKIKVIILSIYRPPRGNINTFIEKTSDCLHRLTAVYCDVNIIITGDFNINFMVESAEKEDLCFLMSTFGLTHVFQEPSRICKTTKTCVDQIFTNIHQVQFYSYTVQPHLSDHLAQMFVFNENPIDSKESEYIRIRKINEVGTYAFINKLEAVQWEEIFQTNQGEQFGRFHEMFMQCFEEAFPEETVRKKESGNSIVHWHTDDLEKSKNELDGLFVIARVLNDAEATQTYEKAKRLHKEKVEKTKQKALYKYIQENDNKNKAIWKVIKHETGGKKSLPLVTRSSPTAEDFARYFSDIGRGISRQITGPPNSADYYVKRVKLNSANSLFLKPVDEAEILDIVRGLKKKKTTDIYGISANLLSKVAHTISVPLTHLVNVSFSEGVFPKELQKAKVIPVYKSGLADDVSNYRPISILPTISKVFEIAIKNRLMTFLERFKLLNKEQHGYRTNRSTITALVNLVDKIAEAFDNEQEIQLTCCDLSKAFDTVDFSMLKKKLEYYGIRGKALELLGSYLDNREQVVHWNGITSEAQRVSCGVPQGSILGPALFVIYTNDLPNSVSCEDMCLYADDTSFLTRKEEAQRTLDEAGEWFNSNNFKMNLEKTQTLLFTTKTTSRETLKLLGLHFDTKLTWRTHVEMLHKSLSTSIFAVRRIRKMVGSEAAKAAYFGSFHSKATYGILLWGGSAAAQRIFVLQKAAIRAMLNLNRRTSCKEYFLQERILTLPCVYILACLSYIHGSTRFPTHNELHSYNTRTKNNLIVPFHRIDKARTGTNYDAVRLYNALPDHLKEVDSKKFIRTVKEYLLNGAFYSIDEFINM